MNIQQKEPVVLYRDCEALLIPVGTPIMLPAGSTVFIVQALGGNYTVNINGNLAQVAAHDADALGFETAPEARADDGGAVLSQGVMEQRIWEQLKTCYDPEIPVNIVDLGLIYGCEIAADEQSGWRAMIRMTLTAPGCGMGGFLAADVRRRVAGVTGVTDVQVHLVFDPPWNLTMMSESARLELGMY